MDKEKIILPWPEARPKGYHSSTHFFPALMKKKVSAGWLMQSAASGLPCEIPKDSAADFTGAADCLSCLPR
ncbi:hypothetical protein Dthio_PD3490 [Desulfonatronospira thiodismutans ASO3-1]|uniref:Uncharacterized protein n=1 Tax=Desulfonatronospira thiodismutans ASO3-1 TaxID=555779 RepID=D6SMY6_9BACT|nr:hypothetical protein [Desulfonatronospira thiodismutans]EFI36047.1 hypothetical protein Dthio_PD3490 [Desulfonatronospira thiodismutans ASO3-1]RQD65425.1 MAG: hypothetical protein D5R98_03475 [Desulfonatronovibrio sp. MSAO_Bac4]